MPLNEDSEPIGSWMGMGFTPRRSRMDSTQASKSAPILSILLTKTMRGTS